MPMYPFLLIEKRDKTMKKTEIKKTATKELINRLDKLSKGSGLNAYEKCLIIKEIFENKKHLKFFKNADNRAEKLQEHAGTMALTVAVCLHMIEFFPNKKDWENGRLDILRDKSAKLLMEKISNTKTTTSKRKCSSWKDKYFKLLEDYRELELKYTDVKGRLESLEKAMSKR